MPAISKIRAKVKTNQNTRREDRRFPLMYVFRECEPSLDDVKAVARTIKSVAERAMKHGLDDPFYRNLKHNQAALFEVKAIKVLASLDKNIIQSQVDCYIGLYGQVAATKAYPPVVHAERYDFYRAKLLLHYPMRIAEPLVIASDDPEIAAIVAALEARWVAEEAEAAMVAS